MNEINRAERLLYLDSARGLAALSVMTWHFLLSVYGLNIEGAHFHTPFRLFWFGEADVIFFYVHSGFILAYTVTRRNFNIGIRSYSAYLIERVFRIYPLFLFILLLSAVLYWNLPPYLSTGEYDYISRFWFSDINAKDLAGQAMLLVRLPESANLRLIPQDWTLTVELLAGASIPLLAYAGRKHLLIFVTLLVLLKWTNWLTTYILEFGTGVALFLFWEPVKKTWNRLPLVGKGGIVLAAIIGYSGCFVFPSLFTSDIELVNGRVDRLVILSGCVLIFLVLLSSARLQRLLSLSFLVYIGKICYSIYLVHQLLLFVSWRLLPEQMNQLREAPVPVVIAVYLVFFLLVLLLSHGGYQLVEKPMIRIGKRFSKRITG